MAFTISAAPRRRQRAVEAESQATADRQGVTALMALGDALAGQRRFEEAIVPLREAHDIYEKNAPMRTPWYQPFAQSSLGAALAGTGDRVEAERLLLAGMKACAPCRRRRRCRSAARPSGSWRSTLPQAGGTMRRRGGTACREWRRPTGNDANGIALAELGVHLGVHAELFHVLLMSFAVFLELDEHPRPCRARDRGSFLTV